MKAVAELRPVELPEPNKNMLYMLEAFRKEVMEGKLNFLAVTATYKDTQGTIMNGYVKEKCAQRFTILGALEDQKISFARGMEGS